jgi:RNA polymerase sigma-70 factor (ECF subfamily)
MTTEVWMPGEGLTPSVVVRARAGERKAEEVAVRRAMELATRTAAAALGRDLAGDVAQAVGMDVLRSLKRLKEPASFDQWVHRITARRVQDMYRQRGRHAEQMRAARTAHVAAVPAQADEYDALEMALSRLSNRQRLAISLYYSHGLSVDEIAQVIRCRRGTAASLLSRGRAALRSDPTLRAALGYPSLEEDT